MSMEFDLYVFEVYEMIQGQGMRNSDGNWSFHTAGTLESNAGPNDKYYYLVCPENYIFASYQVEVSGGNGKYKLTLLNRKRKYQTLQEAKEDLNNWQEALKPPRK
jgi:hypothetical protein